MITKQQLGNTLWGMAEILYDKVEDYKTYILSLLFFKRLSDNWTWEIDNKVRDDSGIYRTIYTARIADAVYVLHAFQKKTQATSKSDIDIAKERYTELMRGRK